MTQQDLIYLNALNTLPSIGPTRLIQIMRYFPNIEEAWQAPSGEFGKIFHDENLVNRIAEEKKKVEPEKEFEKLEKENIKILTINDNSYPSLLKEIYTPPPILYYRGSFFSNCHPGRSEGSSANDCTDSSAASLPQNDKNCNNKACIGVVGARRMTLYGKEATINIASPLARSGITIVSGLAKGIDSVAHEIALENNAETIAVLGSSLDKNSIYPPENKNLADRIINQGGALISEYPIGMPALPQNFPQRNRIISGLSLGVLVVEAKEKSGALITAREALDQNREVFAIPGPITSPLSAGPNNLIKIGAKMTTAADDILEELNIEKISQQEENKKILPSNPEEEEIIKFLSKEPAHIDKLVRQCNINASLVSSTLVIMEMKGMVRNLGSMNYVIV